MNNARPLAIFALLVGIMLLIVWLYLLIIRGIPDFQAHPKESIFHLAVEFCTSFMLIISSLRVLFSDGHGEGMLLLAMGMLFYTLVNTTGYFMEKAGNLIWAINLIVLVPAIYLTVQAFHGSQKKSD